MLLRALKELAPDATFAGVGGEWMQREGFDSLFPLSDLAVMGLLPVLARLPRLVARLDQTVEVILRLQPDVVVLIDAPDFTHRVARRVRAKAPQIPIVDYVSPTVWAWRPWRARQMRSHIDEVLAILPFEPAAYERLQGPPCIYVGHPLIEALPSLEREREPARSSLVLMLPGSREAEIRRMAPLYGAVAAIIGRERPDLTFAVPMAPQMERLVEVETARWSVKPRLLKQAEKFAAFRSARAALVTSGAATLELALARTPVVVAYKVSRAEHLLRFLVAVEHFALPNLILDRRAAPEFLQHDATPRALADHLKQILDEGPARAAQLTAFEELRLKILAAGPRPSALAAQRILRRLSAAKSRGPGSGTKRL